MKILLIILIILGVYLGIGVAWMFYVASQTGEYQFLQILVWPITLILYLTFPDGM